MSESEDIAIFIEEAAISVYGPMMAEMAVSIQKSCDRHGVPESRDKVLYEVLRRSIGVGVLWGPSK